MIAQLNDIAQIWWQWMGSMFWQVSLLIILVSALDMVIRKWAWPQVRYALWTLVFIKLIISPAWQMPTSIVSWIQPQVQEQITFQVEINERTEKGSANYIAPDEVKAPVVEQASWKSFALLIWISGMVIFTFMLLRKMYKFRKIHHVDEKIVIPEWFNELIIKTAVRLKLKNIPSIIFSEDAKSPAVYGVFRPVLLLPDGYLDQLSREQVEHVLIHELCHLKRGDLLVHWFCIILQIVYWFNPLLIWTRRQMRYVCEICCDLSVANILREKTYKYRETLLKSARELFAEKLEPSLGFFGIFEEPFRLVPRLKWLEKKTWKKRKLKISVTLCTSLIMVACVMPMSKPSPSQQNKDISVNTDMENEEAKIVDDGLSKSIAVDKTLRSILLQEVYLEIADIKSRINEINTRIKQVEAKVEETPKREQELVTLNRDYNNLVKLYETMRNRKIEADIAVSMERKQAQATSGKRDKKEESQALGTSAFLADELEAVRKQLVKKEEELKAYMKRYVGALPKDLHTNLATLERLQKKVDQLNYNLRDSEYKRIAILQDFTASNDLEDLVSSLKEQLSLLQSKYASNHPDINRLKQMIAKLEVVLEVDVRNIIIDLDDVDIMVFIKLISELTGKNFVVDTNIKGKVTVVAPNKITVDEAYKLFESVLDVHGFTTEESGAVIKIVKKE